MQAPRDSSKSWFKPPNIKWLLVCVVVGVVAAGGVWVWQSLHSVQAVCDQAVLEKRAQLVKRREAKEKAEIEQARLEREAQRAEDDAHDREERLKWVAVIDAASAAMPETIVESANVPFAGLDGIEASTEVTEDDADFWSFQRLVHVQPPPVADRSWCINPIDQFILARLTAAGLPPNPAADQRVLGRRLWFDLVGLPPSSEKITAFATANDSESYDRLVDELLAHPGFGERWGRIWLDLARYADSNGYEEDEIRPYAYPYRDFVIWAMNVDLPFDLFLRWQIAGDELAADSPMAVAATGFFTGAPLNTFIPQKSERMDELDDMVSTFSRAMLGLTVGCARCHDHKYDPIPTRDYYGLVAIFSETSRHHSYLVADGGKEYRRWFDPVDKRRREIKEMERARIKEDNISELDYFSEEEKDLLRQPIDPNNQEQERLISLCERCLLIMDHQLAGDFEPLPEDRDRYEQLKAELEELEPLLPPQPPMGLTLTGSNVSRTHVLEGSDLNRKREEVGPGFLTVVTPARPVWNDDAWKSWAIGDDGVSRPPRTALARWSTDIEHGAGSLVARVIVNRLWQHHFGEGLVRTPSDFGSEGEEPSHPELLEWLASELVEHNWSLKHIHRLIVTSATYRQATTLTEEKRRLDPENRLVGRHAPNRVTAEMMRDAMFFTAGNLNQDMHGPGIKPPIPRDAVYNTQEDPEDTWPSDYEADRPSLWRRGIYVMLKRTIPVPMLRLFDAPDGSFSCHQRKMTTVPTQALALWNAPFVTRQSERLAHRIALTATTRDEQVRQLFMLTVSRDPTDEEFELAINFLSRNRGEDSPGEQSQSLVELCHVMFMSNEFSYID